MPNNDGHKKLDIVSFRTFLMVILCVGTINQFSQRICLSMAVICMTNHTALDLINEESNVRVKQGQNASQCGTSTTDSSSKTWMLKDGPFSWDSETRGHILGVFFWGYLVGQIPTGLLLRKFGARRIMLINLITFGSATALIPVSVKFNVYLLYALRIISGFVSSAWLPGFYQIWACWAPPNERGVLIGISFAGMHIGNAIALSISGAFCQTSIGWPLIFYFYGACSLLFSIIWLIFVYDTPTKHPKISHKERKYLVSVCGNPGKETETLKSIPVLKMAGSLPFWAFILFVVGYDWNNYTFLTIIPTYMKEVLAFDISENAGLSALPFLGLLIGQVFSGWLTDWILARKILSLKVVRKSTTAIGMFGPGIVLIVISLLDCQHKYVVVALFTFGLVLNSGVFAGGFLNPIELSPRHAGIILSVGNTLSALAGVGGPLLAGILTRNGSYEEWRNVFYIGSAVYFATGIFFVCFSSTSIQPWAIDSTDVFSSGDLGIPVTLDGLVKELHTGSLESIAAWKEQDENGELLSKFANT